MLILMLNTEQHRSDSKCQQNIWTYSGGVAAPDGTMLYNADQAWDHYNGLDKW